MKNPISGTDPGMPSRRAILKGVAVAPIIALPTAALPFAPPPAAPQPAVAENPKLLALGEELPRVEAAYREAVAAWDVMWREWEPKWPLAPDVCTGQRASYGSDIERDLRGAGLFREGQDEPLRVMSLAYMEWNRERCLEKLAKNDRRKRKVSAKTVAYWQSEVERMDRAMLLLPGYLEECDRIRRASDFQTINEARNVASEGVFTFAQKVLSEPSTTIAGIRVKAEAIAVIGRMRRWDASIWSMRYAAGPPAESMIVMLGNAMLEVV
ncbi:hypothetical protein [Haematobacter genomosp. 1]|uniref:Uncharacterized protein n=1 Tax=Haematobacter genomosp. 1 TaxID=366618 RepID=A0A212AA06_9RHOB|nr:hypothetical protein [Haematobacter genomosp. 1]OWJ76985.1 hypothetical protein CDV49_12570 [Haematobacter genomosp. 1]